MVGPRGVWHTFPARRPPPWDTGAGVRIVSLLPSATEIVAALGLRDALVGRSHECDHPAWVASVPAVTSTRLATDPLDSAGIDRAVCEATAGEGLYRLDEGLLAKARPELILTQGLCAVCAVEVGEVERIAAGLPTRPRVLSLDPDTLDDVLECVIVVGRATGTEARARRLRAALLERLAALAERVAGRPRPRVAFLEWLDPPYAGGHWVPEQVRHAGGMDIMGQEGRPSRRVSHAEIVAADPEVIVLGPCGWDAQQALAAAEREGVLRRYRATRAVREGRVVAVDAASHFSRPGPRLVDGCEALAALLHPDVEPPPATAQAPLRRPAPAAVG